MDLKNKISIILPVINETDSLRETVDILLQENQETIREIIIVVAKITTQESLSIIHDLEKKYPGLIKVLEQKLKFLGGAMRDSFDAAKGEWVLMMASDLETDPHTVKALIQEAGTGKWDIVTASRWIKARSFKGYNPVKFILNFFFQKFFQILYRTKLSDLTFGFRIFRSEIVKNINWEELKHPFLLETILKPLRLGYRVTEIPSSWRARHEGESQNTFFANFVYFRIGVRVLFLKKKQLLKSVV